MKKGLLSLSENEKSRILEMHYRASGKNFISENVEDYYKNSTYMNGDGTLIESFNIDEQTKLRQAMSKVRTAIQGTPLMVKWQNWRQNKFIKKKGLPTKEQLMAKDSDVVKNTPGYETVIYLMYNKRTMDKFTITYWNGVPALGGDVNPEDKRVMGQLITQLSRFNGADVPTGYEGEEPTKLELTDFIEVLKKLYDQQIFLTGDDILEIFDIDSARALSAIFSLAITSQYNGKDYDLSTLGAAWSEIEGLNFASTLKNDLNKLVNFSSKLQIAAGGTEGRGKNKVGAMDSMATYEVSLSDEDKIKIINGVQSQIQSDKQTYPNLRVEDYTSFIIGPEELSIKSNIIKGKETVTGAGEVEITALYYSYPDNPNDAKTANVIFGNSDNNTTWNNPQGFADNFAARVNAITSSGGIIYRVEYNAGARSSKVGTKKYGGTTEEQKTKGNVTLCQERADAIVSGIEPIIKQLLPDAAMAKQKPNLHPNQGPAWYEYDDSEGKYGPLFLEYYQKMDNDVNPVDFYTAKDVENTLQSVSAVLGKKLTKEDIKAEYEQVYGPFRGTYAGYSLYYYTENPKEPEPKKEPEVEVEIKKAGTWFYALEYDVITTRDVISSTVRFIKSRWRKLKRKIRKIDLNKFKFSSGGGTGECLVCICDAYN
jgi:hypothetical protein